MSKGIDLRLLIQLIAQFCEFLRCLCQDFLGPLLGVHDGIPVIHEHAGQGTAEILIDVVKNAGHIEDRANMAGLVPKRQSFHLVDVEPQQAAEPLIRKPRENCRLQKRMVCGRKALSDVTFDDPSVRIIPLLHRAVRQTEFLAPFLICRLLPQEISPHLLFQHVQAIVLALAGLRRVGVKGDRGARAGYTTLSVKSRCTILSRNAGALISLGFGSNIMNASSPAGIYFPLRSQSPSLIRFSVSCSSKMASGFLLRLPLRVLR